MFEAFVSDKNIFNKTFLMSYDEQATTGSTVRMPVFCFCGWDCFKNLEDSRYRLAK